MNRRSPSSQRGKSGAPPANTRKSGGAGSTPVPSSKPKPKKQGPPLGTALSVAVLACALLSLAGLSLLWGSGGGGHGEFVEVTLPAGASSSSVAELLEAQGIVRRQRLFALYLGLFWGSDAVQSGPHLLADNLNPRQIALRLTRDATRDRVQVTVPEGWTRFQIARRLDEKRVCSAQAFLDATADAPLLRELAIAADSAEGYLFPATYQLFVDSDPRQVVRSFKAEFDRRITKLRTSQPTPGPARELGWTLHQVLTMASVVEREAAVDDERPLVASAFYNRFRDPNFTPKPPRLQSDATTAYGCQALRQRVPSCAGYSGRVTPEMNADPANPYSTYAHPGLPPGPIANPGERSLSAAMFPAETKFLYFVGKGGGRHAFSETLAEHNAAVRQLRELRQGH